MAKLERLTIEPDTKLGFTRQFLVMGDGGWGLVERFRFTITNYRLPITYYQVPLNALL